MPERVHLIAAARPNFMKVAPLYHALKVGPSLLGSRPEIRFYGTYLNILDNELSQFKFNDNSNNEFMAGIQAEVWW